MLVPTRRFWWLFCAGVPLALVGALIPGFEMVVIPYDLLLFVLLILSGIYRRRTLSLFITRRFDPVLSVRVPNTIQLEVHNDGEDVTGFLRDEAPQEFESSEREFRLDAKSGSDQIIHYSVRPHERGGFFFKGTFVRALAPLGLCFVQLKPATEQPVRVYPNVKAIKEFDLLKQRGRLNLIGVRKSRIKGLGTEFESLREYNEDDFRRIDWKTTARRGKLVVRDYEQERNQAVIVCLDIGRHMLSEVQGVKKLDHALDACLMLLHAASVSGDQVGLLVFADVVRRYLPPRKGRNQNGAILDAVHGLSAEPVESNYSGAFSYLATRWKRRSLVVVFTDAEDEQGAESIVTAIAPLARRHLLMVVRVSDPRLKELVDSPIRTTKEMYDKSAALWYANDRKRAESKLSSFGIHSIDSEPQDLSAALVSAYLRVKETSAL